MKHETGIPLPKPEVRYPLYRLEVGDCMTFDVPASTTALDFSRAVRCAARRYRLKLGTQYTVRKISNQQIRVWRTE